MDALLSSVDRGVCTLVLNRPDARNALDRALLNALDRALARAEEEPGIRVLLLRGAGDRAFCAGADLGELAGLDAHGAREHLRVGQAVLRRLERARVPSIAAVHGYALGGGFELALACSFIVASQDAQFGLPEAGLGLLPGYGGTQRLVAAIGRGPALRVMLTGQRLSAADAERLGLLAEPATAPLDLAARAEELASAVAASGPLAVASILEAVNRADDNRLDHETALAALALGSAEGLEGIAAFRERRPPRWAR